MLKTMKFKSRQARSPEDGGWWTVLLLTGPIAAAIIAGSRLLDTPSAQAELPPAPVSPGNESTLTAAAVVVAADSTAQFEMSADARAAVERGLKHLAERQLESGSLGGEEIGADAAIAGLAGLAFLLADDRTEGGTYSEKMLRCQKFVLGQARDDGFIGKSSMYGHAIATRFLIEWQRRRPSDEVKKTAEKAVALCERCQNGAGGWRYQPAKTDGDTSVTACVPLTLAAAERNKFDVGRETLASGGKYLLACQNQDGGFCYTTPGQGSAPGRSAAAAAALAALHADAEKIDAALGYLQQNFETVQAGPAWHNTYSFYAFSQAFAERPNLAEKWYVLAAPRLVKAQREDGSWQDQSHSGFATATACVVLQLPRWAGK